MRSRFGWIVALAMSSGTIATAQTAVLDPPDASADPVFRTKVELVALSVTVTDQQQRYIAGLGEDEFAVYEDGVRQEVKFFAASQVPLDMAILLDTSASMTERMSHVQEAAIGFARTLRPGDRAAIMGVNDSARLLQDFTGDIGELQAAILRTRAQGATALHNALYVMLKEFTRDSAKNPDVRRQAIVVLSDGQDTTSLVSFDHVLDLAKRSGVSIYTICLKSRYDLMRARAKGGRVYFSQSDYSMKTLAQETGARTFLPNNVDELSGVYEEIAKELANQYALGYAPRNVRRDGAFRRVIVKVLTRPDARSRTRSGYFADRERGAALESYR